MTVIVTKWKCTTQHTTVLQPAGLIVGSYTADHWHMLHTPQQAVIIS